MHARNWKWRVFRALDLIVVSVMILSSPLTVYAAVADVTAGSDAAESLANPVVAVEPLDTSPGKVEASVEEQAVMPEEAWNTLANTLNLAGPQSPALNGSGQADVISNVGCMEESAGFSLNCTANDINIAKATNIAILDDGCAFPGDTVTFKADFEVLLTAQARYDVGLWFASDGDPNNDAAKTGSCTAATPAYAPDPPWLDLDQAVAGQENDTCGDINDAHNPLYPSVTLTVVCTDDDANGKLDLPNCTSWRQPGDNSLCTSPVQAVPGAPSKCKCDTGFNVDIPVPGQIIVDKVTSPAGLTTNFDFTLTGTPTGGSAITPVTFSLTDASAPFKSSFLYAGTYSVVETANSSYATIATCSDGSPANAIALAPGEIVTCTFTNTLQTGTLVVNKTVINDNSGTKTCADFSFAVDGGTASAFEADCSNSVTVLAGSHTVVEAGVPIDGYTTTYNNCSNVSVPAGGTATCTITNDDVAVPGMTVDKSSATTELSAPGPVTYSYLVTNTGNTTLTGIALSDNNDNDDMSCPKTSLVKGESMTCTATHTFTQAELDAGGTLNNTVTADSNETEPVTDSLSIPIMQNPAINVEKSSATSLVVNAGQVVPYTFLVTNAGNVTLTGITVTDPMCATAPAFVSGDANADNKLQIGEAWTYTCSHTVTQAEIDTGGTLRNTVTADSVESEPDTDTLDIPITQTTAIIVVKASTTVEITVAGQVVPYTFTVTNGGNTTLTGITVTDPMCNVAPAYQSGDDGDGKLQVSETWTYTCEHTVTQAEIDSDGGGDGDLDNTVTADSNESGPDMDDHAIPIDYYPFLTVEKSSETTSLSAPATVTYSYLVKNTGNVTLTGIVLSDNNDEDDMSCLATTLSPGASMTCTATHTFTQAELDTLTSLDNVVTADSNESAPDTDELSIPITKNAAILVVKASTTTQVAGAGQVVPYTFTVDNEGNTTLTGITVTDPMCDAAPAFVSGDINNDGMLQVDETWTYSCNHTVTQAEIDTKGGGDGDLDNTVTADSNESAPDTDDHAIPVLYNPVLMVVKSSTTTAVTAAGQVVPYTFVVTNIGNVTLTGITVEDAMCDEVPTYQLGDANTDSKLDLAETWTYNCSHTVTQAEMDEGGNLHNNVLADSVESEPDVDSLDIPITQTNAIIVVKASTTVEIAHAGQVVPYTFTVNNKGNTTLTGITVIDPMCDVDPAYVSGDINGDSKLQTGETWLYTCDHTVTQAEVDAGGDLINTVTADSNESAPDTDTLVIPVTQTPLISLAKSGTFDAGADGFANVGELISYEFLVTNEGNLTLTGVTVTDPKVSNIFCPADTLAVGASMTCTGTYAVTQADIDAGSVYNMATADSTQSEPDTDDETVQLPKNPAISLEKTGTFGAGADGYANVGELISYEFLVTNTGNVTLTGITVTDPKVSPITCPADTLAVGTNMICTGSYAVTQADIDAGFVYNLATADSNESGPDDGENNEPLPQNAALMLVKTGTFGAGEDGFANVGELISYTFEITNTGNVTLTGITVTDPKVSNISCPADTLAVGESMTCTGSYAVTQADIDAGSVYNMATADSTQSGPDTDDETETLPQNPAISLTKSAAPTTYDAVGDLITYTYVITNTGNVTLPGPFIVSDDKATVTCDPVPAGGVALQGTLSCTATYTIKQSDVDAGSVTNTATASTTYNNQNVTSLPASATVTAIQNPAIEVLKFGTFMDENGNGYADVGETIAYTFTVKNTGNVTLYNIVVTDPLVTVSGGPLASLAPGSEDTTTFTATYTLTQDDIDAGSVYNKATACGYDAQNDEACDDGTNDEPTPQNPLISIDKSGTFDAGADGYANVGELISYEFLVKNEGNVTLTGITVTDPKVDPISCPAITLAVGASMTCTGTYAVTQSDIDAGFVYNMATADSTESEPDTDDETETLPQNPALMVEKTVTSTGPYDSVSDVITYTLVATNTGNVTLTNVSIADPLLGTLTCTQPVSLAPGATLTCTGSYAITQTDLDNGKVDNTATATGTFGDDDYTDTDSETVPTQQSPAITLTKAATPTLYDAAGDVITYTLVAKNTGNVTLHDVSITDAKLGALTCTPNQPAMLAPNATLTCTGTYTIQAADLTVFSITNTATVTGKGPQDQPVTATATATIYRQTGALLPTQTTCQMYAGGPSMWPTMYDAFTYQVKGNKISSVSPGVIFYYNTITAPSSSFTLSVTQTNSASWKPMLIQDLGQAILYTSNCTKAAGVTVSTTNNPYTVNFTVTGATPGAIYYIGIKYSPQNLVGQPVSKNQTSIYYFSTTGYTGSEASIPVKPKK